MAYKGIYYRRKKRRLRKWIALIICIGAIFFLWHNMKPSREEIIRRNQAQALETARDIMQALHRWKNSDYDGNGKKDYPLGELNKLIHTRFVNNQKLELIPQEVANADLRLENPVPYEGYFFTLVSEGTKWPEDTGMRNNIQVLAVPKEVGKTGTCTFYLNEMGEEIFTNYRLDRKVPPWPYGRRAKELWQDVP